VRISAAAPLPQFARSRRRQVRSLVPFAAVCVAAVLVATSTGTSSLIVALGIAAGVGVMAWMFFSERMEGPLITFLLYLGLLDGFVKLRTNSSGVTLGRDALLGAIVLGFLARSALRRRPLRLPPLSGWVLAFTAVVLVQVANPADTGLQHTLGALRPHLEFVPLFFIGYAMLRTRARLRTFFVIMLVIAMANGIVGAVQLNLTPAQLASWGPGYQTRVYGTGTGVSQVSGRTYTTSAGTARTRPFGLGDDSGIGEEWGMLALGGALALLALGLRRSAGRVALLLCVGPPLAIITGEGRSLLVGSAIALVAYVLFATTAKRLIPTMAAVLLGLGAIIAVFAFVGSVSGSGVFDRYLTITPSSVVASTAAERGNSLADIPRFITRYPLGNGLGSVGPASNFAGGGNSGSNGETEPTFLLSELGIPGLIVVYGFTLHLLFLGTRRIRLLDTETRSYVAALLAGIAALLIVGVSAATTATSPGSPYLWFVGGALSYWLTTGVKSARDMSLDADTTAQASLTS
jgi:hypothetical protein